MARCCSHAPARHVISPSLPGRCVTPAPQQPPPGSLRHHRLGQAVRQCRPWGVKVVTRRTLSACVFLAARAFAVRRKVVGFRRFGGHRRGLSPPPPGTVPTSGRLWASAALAGTSGDCPHLRPHLRPSGGKLWASAALAGTSGDCPHLRPHLRPSGGRLWASAALAGTSGDCPHLRAALAGTSGDCPHLRSPPPRRFGGHLRGLSRSASNFAWSIAPAPPPTWSMAALVVSNG